MYAGRIHKNYLGILVSEDAPDVIARGLGFRARNGDFLFHESVQYSGFSHIWLAANGHKT